LGMVICGILIHDQGDAPACDSTTGGLAAVVVASPRTIGEPKAKTSKPAAHRQRAAFMIDALESLTILKWETAGGPIAQP
jgi:hypothetical protein